MSRRIGIAVLGLAAISASLAFAQAPQDNKPAPKTPAAKQTPPAGDKPQLPEGMTEAEAEMMKVCMEAGTPGEMHEYLAKSVGTWKGECKMWMKPGAEPQTSECTSTVTTMMDGRFTKCEMSGDMMGMPFNGFGIYGFDNVAQEFQSSWISNCGTGIMNGVGELSSDQKTLTWVFTHNCPITKQPTTMREVETITGKDTKTLVMYATDLASGDEFKTMEITFTRQPAKTAAATN